MARLTDINAASAVTLDSIIHIVNTGDTSQSPEGSSYYAPLSDLSPLFSGGSSGSSIDTYSTGFTYNNANTFTISQNEGQPNLTSTFNTVTGLTSTGTITTNTLSATTLNTTTLTVNGSPVTGGGGTSLTWETKTNIGGITWSANSNYGYVSNNGHPANASVYQLPTTASTGDIVKVVVLDGIAGIDCDASQSVVYGTGNNDTGGSFTQPFAFYFGKYEAIQMLYLGSNKWIIDSFMTTEDLYSNPLSTRIL
jgi:hypothetical protein